MTAGEITAGYLSTAEACERLGVSRDTLRKLIRDGLIEAYQVSDGRTSPWRVSEDAVVAYIARRTAAAVAS